MTDEELAKRLESASGCGAAMHEIMDLAASRIRQLAAVERAAREYDAAYTDNIDLDCDASMLRVHKARSNLRTALEGGSR
jgi:hypothetical protein